MIGNIRELGIDTLKLCEMEEIEMLKLAQTMFDTKLPPGVKMLQPFSEGSSIKKISVRVCMSSIDAAKAVVFFLYYYMEDLNFV